MAYVNEVSYSIERNLKITSIQMSFEAIYNENFFFEGEKHNFWEMVYVFDGKVGISADDRIYELSDNEVVFHMPGEFHRIWTAGNTNPHLFIVSFTATGDTKRLEKLVFKVSEQQKLNLLNFIFSLAELSQKTFIDHSLKGMRIWYSNPVISQTLGNLLEIYLLSVISSNIELKEKRKDRGTILYKNIIKILQENIESNISINEIAKKCNMSVSGLKKIFTKYSGTSIHKYYLNAKITHAIKLMEEDWSFSNISEKLGFDNQNYFSTVFKRVTGITPSQYKKKL